MNASARDLRILVMAPTAKDGGITTDLLNGAGIETATFTALDALVNALNDGAAAVLVAEEHLTAAHKAPLVDVADAPAAVVGPADPDPDAARRRLAGLRRGVAHARQRHAARAADARHDAPERGADGDSRALAPVPDPRPPRRAAEERAGLALGGSPQGRIPGDARARAAQPAGADFEQPRDHEAVRGVRQSAHAAGRRSDGAPDPSPQSPRRRSPRSVAHYARCHRGPQGTPRPDEHRQGGDRDQPAGARQPPPRALGRARSGGHVRRRRSGAPHPGVRQPAQQRRQVHEPRRAHLDRDPARERRGGHQREGQRHRHRAQRAGAGVRHVHAGRSLDAAIAGRARHRPDAGAEPRRHARRQRRGAQRRPRARQRVHRAIAAAERSARLDRAAAADRSRCRRAES